MSRLLDHRTQLVHFLFDDSAPQEVTKPESPRPRIPTGAEACGEPGAPPHCPTTPLSGASSPSSSEGWPRVPAVSGPDVAQGRVSIRSC